MEFRLCETLENCITFLSVEPFVSGCLLVML
jgi:hypothetical protein